MVTRFKVACCYGRRPCPFRDVWLNSFIHSFICFVLKVELHLVIRHSISTHFGKIDELK